MYMYLFIYLYGYVVTVFKGQSCILANVVLTKPLSSDGKSNEKNNSTCNKSSFSDESIQYSKVIQCFLNFTTRTIKYLAVSKSKSMTMLRPLAECFWNVKALGNMLCFASNITIHNTTRNYEYGHLLSKFCSQAREVSVRTQDPGIQPSLCSVTWIVGLGGWQKKVCKGVGG